MDATQLIEDLVPSDRQEEEEEEERGGRRKPLGQLKVFSNAHFKEMDFPIYAGENVIGREPGCAVTLPASSISKRHAVLQVHQGEHLLWDCGSLNGTRRGRAQLTPQVRYSLSQGDLLVFADLPCQYTLLKKSEPPTLPPGSAPRVRSQPRRQVRPLALEKTPGPVLSLVPESDEEEEEGKDGKGNVSGFSRGKGPNTSAILSPMSTIIPESDDESPITPSPTAVARCGLLQSSAEGSSILGGRDPVRPQPNAKEPRRKKRAGGRRMRNDSGESDSEGGEEWTSVKDRREMEEAAETTARVCANGEGGSRAGVPLSDQSGLTGAGGKGCSSRVKPQEASGSAQNRPQELHEGRAESGGPADLHLDSDTDVEEEDSSKSPEAKRQEPGVVAEEELEARKEFEKAVPESVKKEKVLAFHPDSDTDVEEEDVSKPPEAKRQEPVSTAVEKPDAGEISKKAELERKEGILAFHPDSDTDVEEEDVSKPPEAKRQEPVSTVVEKPHAGEISKKAELERKEGILAFHPDSDTDVEEEEEPGHSPPPRGQPNLSPTQHRSGGDTPALHQDNSVDVEEEKIDLPSDLEAQPPSAPDSKPQEPTSTALDPGAFILDSDTDVDEEVEEAPVGEDHGLLAFKPTEATGPKAGDLAGGALWEEVPDKQGEMSGLPGGDRHSSSKAGGDVDSDTDVEAEEEVGKPRAAVAPSALNLDSDSDVEEAEDDGGSDGRGQATPVKEDTGKDNDTDVEQAKDIPVKPHSLASEPKLDRPLPANRGTVAGGFELDSDTDVEDDLSDCPASPRETGLPGALQQCSTPLAPGDSPCKAVLFQSDTEAKGKAEGPGGRKGAESARHERPGRIGAQLLGQPSDSDSEGSPSFLVQPTQCYISTEEEDPPGGDKEEEETQAFIPEEDPFRRPLNPPSLPQCHPVVEEEEEEDMVIAETQSFVSPREDSDSKDAALEATQAYASQHPPDTEDQPTQAFTFDMGPPKSSPRFPRLSHNVAADATQAFLDTDLEETQAFDMTSADTQPLGGPRPAARCPSLSPNPSASPSHDGETQPLDGVSVGAVEDTQPMGLELSETQPAVTQQGLGEQASEQGQSQSSELSSADTLPVFQWRQRGRGGGGSSASGGTSMDEGDTQAMDSDLDSHLSTADTQLVHPRGVAAPDPVEPPRQYQSDTQPAPVPPPQDPQPGHQGNRLSPITEEGSVTSSAGESCHAKPDMDTSAAAPDAPSSPKQGERNGSGVEDRPHTGQSGALTAPQEESAQSSLEVESTHSEKTASGPTVEIGVPLGRQGSGEDNMDELDAAILTPQQAEEPTAPVALPPASISQRGSMRTPRQAKKTRTNVEEEGGEKQGVEDKTEGVALSYSPAEEKRGQRRTSRLRKNRQEREREGVEERGGGGGGADLTQDSRGQPVVEKALGEAEDVGNDGGTQKKREDNSEPSSETPVNQDIATAAAQVQEGAKEQASEGEALPKIASIFLRRCTDTQDSPGGRNSRKLGKGVSTAGESLGAGGETSTRDGGGKQGRRAQEVEVSDALGKVEAGTKERTEGEEEEVQREAEETPKEVESREESGRDTLQNARSQRRGKREVVAPSKGRGGKRRLMSNSNRDGGLLLDPGDACPETKGQMAASDIREGRKEEDEEKNISSTAQDLVGTVEPVDTVEPVETAVDKQEATEEGEKSSGARRTARVKSLSKATRGNLRTGQPAGGREEASGEGGSSAATLTTDPEEHNDKEPVSEAAGGPGTAKVGGTQSGSGSVQSEAVPEQEAAVEGHPGAPETPQTRRASRGRAGPSKAQAKGKQRTRRNEGAEGTLEPSGPSESAEATEPASPGIPEMGHTLAGSRRSSSGSVCSLRSEQEGGSGQEILNPAAQAGRKAAPRSKRQARDRAAQPDAPEKSTGGGGGGRRSTRRGLVVGEEADDGGPDKALETESPPEKDEAPAIAVEVPGRRSRLASVSSNQSESSAEQTAGGRRSKKRAASPGEAADDSRDPDVKVSKRGSRAGGRSRAAVRKAEENGELDSAGSSAAGEPEETKEPGSNLQVPGPSKRGGNRSRSVAGGVLAENVPQKEKEEEKKEVAAPVRSGRGRKAAAPPETEVGEAVSDQATTPRTPRRGQKRPAGGKGESVSSEPAEEASEEGDFKVPRPRAKPRKGGTEELDAGCSVETCAAGKGRGTRGRASLATVQPAKDEQQGPGSPAGASSEEQEGREAETQSPQAPRTPSPQKSNKASSRKRPPQNLDSTPPEAKTPRGPAARAALSGVSPRAAAPTKVLFTGVRDEAAEEVVCRLGGSMTEGVHDCTHLVTDRVRRTVKLLCAVARGVPVVTTHWLDKCGKSGCFLPPSGFLVKDTVQEKNFNFSLAESLLRASKQPLLQGYEIHVTPSVKPEPAQMKDIIVCSGARYLPKMPTVHKEHTVVVSCLEDATRCQPALRAGLPVVSAEFLLTGILRQSAELDCHCLTGPGFELKAEAKGRGGGGRRKR